MKANAKVAENLYRKATGEGRESVTAAIFWLKTRAGWKETSVHELGGRDGRPLQVEVEPRLARSSRLPSSISSTGQTRRGSRSNVYWSRTDRM